MSLPLLILSFLVLWASACAPSPSSSSGMDPGASPTQDLVGQAAAEATAIVQRAQATALVLQAQAEATALAREAQTPESTAAPQTLPVLPWPTHADAGAEVDTALTLTETGQAAGEAEAVELLGVGFAAEGAFIIVNYRAPPRVAQTFWPGVLSATDEASGTVFNEVPLMPLIGPLIARPIEAGQVGYVMLVHAPPILRSGSLVTVVLCDYTFEHVPVD